MSHFLPKTANITKPQKKFRIPVDNTLNHFVPTITEKPNALTPLDTSPICSKKGKIIQGFRHPYEFEIDNFVLNVWQCTTSDPIVPKPLNQTDLIHIDTIERLQQFIDELKDEQEIAIDLEGHIRRSFQVKKLKFLIIFVINCSNQNMASPQICGVCCFQELLSS